MPTDSSTSTVPAIVRVVVSASNLTRSLGFYHGVLGLPVQHQADGAAFLRTGDGIELMLHERPAIPSDTAVAITFALKDLDAVIEPCSDAGATVIDPPARQPWGEVMAVVRDPDGHIVCLCERGRP